MTRTFTLIFFLLISVLGYSQCDNRNTPTSVKLTSLNLEEAEFQFCYRDSCDLLIVSQDYDKRDLITPKLIRSVEEGNYLLKNNRLILFTTDNSKFQLKLIREEKIFNISVYDKITIYSYYEVTRSKLKLILLGNIETIDVVRDDEIQTFEVPYPKAFDFYQMTYRYFKWKKWR
jgi:hypothetical protein